ncbi:hypothetical protein BDZ45DRAFT_731498 [Acephala macrosclerotiorum]|nr:hypothetical protein BDZ45DRAFT_731498 [Acephala macrosclerotiorum]
MNTTYTQLNLPTSQTIHVLTTLLNEQECNTIISQHRDLIPSNVTPATVRDREAFDDPVLAELIWERLGRFYEVKMEGAETKEVDTGNGDGKRGIERMVKDEDGCLWEVEGLNERFRLCRYLPEGKFSPHLDGQRFASVDSCSFMTVNIYLNTVPSEHKGATRFLTIPGPKVLAQVQPVLGTAAIFRETVWHDGEELAGGEKYLLRTDVMYRRVKEFDFEELYGGLGDEEKGRKMLEIAERLEDSGESMEAVKWYKKAFRLWPALER